MSIGTSKISRFRILWGGIIFALLALTVQAGFFDSKGEYPDNPYMLEDNGQVIATAINPDPEVYPTMHCQLHTHKIAFIVIRFPNVPGSRVDACTYETTNAEIRFDFIELALPAPNQFRLRHRLTDLPQLIMVTTLTAEPGAVKVEAHLELDPEMKDKADELPQRLRWPNLCWSFRKSSTFVPGGVPDGPNIGTKDVYYDWIKRCFIFTEDGFTHLDETRRRKTVEVSEDDIRNSPPLYAWSQHYAGVWQDPDSPRFHPNTSLDGYVIPLIGAVSNDGEYLVALASDWTEYIAQAWNVCFHHIPQWMPEDKPLLDRRWRMKLYAMENDPDELLKKAKEDFPEAAKRLKGAKSQ